MTSGRSSEVHFKTFSSVMAPGVIANQDRAKVPQIRGLGTMLPVSGGMGFGYVRGTT